MAEFTSQALKDEISNDPTGLQYAGKADNQIADILNNKAFTARGPINGTFLVKKWAVVRGIWSKLIAGTQNGALSHVHKSCCYCLLNIFENPSLVTNFDDSDFVDLISALVASGVIDAADRAALQTVTTVSASRAEVLFGVGTTINHTQVGLALRG